MRIQILIIIFFLLIPYKIQNFPTSFSLRQDNDAWPYYTQAWGTCWAHATTLGLELDLLKQNKRVTLSPYYLDKFNGFNKNGESGEREKGEESGQGQRFLGTNLDDPSSGVTVHQGGDFLMAAAALANLGGVPQEDESMRISSNNLDFEKFESGIKRQNKNSFFIPRRVEFYPDANEQVERMKFLILNGTSILSVHLVQDQPTAEINGKDLYFYNGTEGPNHAVNIIGWDDNIFGGSWIVQDSYLKNKAGKRIKDFYVPFNDKHLLNYKEISPAVVADVVQRRYKEVLTHSRHGHRYTTDEGDMDHLAIKFKLDKTMNLSAIGLFLPYSGAKYRVSIALGPNSKGDLIAIGRGGMAGFYLVDIDPVRVLRGVHYFLLELDKRIYAYDASFLMNIALGDPLKRIQVNSKASEGEAFYFRDGWHDFSGYISKKNSQKENIHAKENRTASPAFYLYLN